MLPLLKKHHNEKFLIPSSDSLNERIIQILNESKVDWTKAIMYQTKSSDLSDINLDEYELLVFFSPQDVKSLVENFKDYQDKKFKIATFGMTTKVAVEEIGLKVDIVTPTPENPSMAKAISDFIE